MMGQGNSSSAEHCKESRTMRCPPSSLPPHQQQQLSITANTINPCQNFVDLNHLPPEIAISILSKLDATDLCLASCVWKDLAEDELLWKSLCMMKWRYASIYNCMEDIYTSKIKKKPIYKNIYLLLDEATLIFAFKPSNGINYLIDNGVLEDNPTDLAKFLDGTTALYTKNIQMFLQDRSDVLTELIKLQQFQSLSICDALRTFFQKVPPPEQRGEFLHTIIDKFADKFYECNPDCAFNKDHIAVLCYSLLLLSVDLYSPHVKNKMTKREFIRNNRQVLVDANRDILSDIYDDVYLNGHIVPNTSHVNEKRRKEQQNRFPFYRPYGAIFEFKPSELKMTCSCWTSVEA